MGQGMKQAATIRGYLRRLAPGRVIVAEASNRDGIASGH